jgi:uncharacterized protein YbjT (DUF2867 family)
MLITGAAGLVGSRLCQRTVRTTPETERGYGTMSRNPSGLLPKFGAADRIRTGDVQLGKLAFCH